MASLRLDIDADTYTRLVERAVAERRPINWQAEVELRRAVGLPFPESAKSSGARRSADRAAVEATQ
jgi:hypothetical protein